MEWSSIWLACCPSDGELLITIRWVLWVFCGAVYLVWQLLWTFSRNINAFFYWKKCTFDTFTYYGKWFGHIWQGEAHFLVSWNAGLWIGTHMKVNSPNMRTTKDLVMNAATHAFQIRNCHHLLVMLGRYHRTMTNIISYFWVNFLSNSYESKTGDCDDHCAPFSYQLSYLSSRYLFIATKYRSKTFCSNNLDFV